MAKVYSKRIKKLARGLRNNGRSIGEISLKMKIPKNTLSGWVKDILLTRKQKARIKNKIIAYSLIGRKLAAIAWRNKINKWKEGICNEVRHFSALANQSPEIGKLICGILYICEGAKYPSSRYLYLGNSDPKIISFFIKSLRKYFNIDGEKLRFDVMYRYDQDYGELKKYWSKVTNIPISKCLRSKPDLRTKGKPTLKRNYKGICRVIYYDTTLQFKLQSIGEIAIKNGAEGS